MASREGPRSVRARYKPSPAKTANVTSRGSALLMAASPTDALWDVQPCAPHLLRSPSMITSSSSSSSDSSRVCGMAIADLTTRHSDSSSSGSCSVPRVVSGNDCNGACDNVFSISTTKSDPRFNSTSSNSSISHTQNGGNRRKADGRWRLAVGDHSDDTAKKRRVRPTAGVDCRVPGLRRHQGHSSSGSASVRCTSNTLARLLVLFVSSIFLCHHWHAGHPNLPLLLDGVGAVLLDTNTGDGKAPVQAFGDGLGGTNLEQSIAAVFSRVAYGSTTTTKRSIPDNVYVPSLTTVSTPLLTTFRYREKDKEPIGGPGTGGAGPGGDKDSHYNQQQISANHRNYELDLERDHVLPTSAPNAEILKSNSNPTYPNPNRHHNHDRHRHSNSTPYPHGHNAKKGFPTNSMFSGDIPAYSPPSRTLFTAPLPRNYTNPFADKPTLRGTNSDSTIINTGTYANRRPLPPPSLMPGHERIPMRPPDLVPGAPGAGGVLSSGGPPIGGPAGSLKPQKVGTVDPAYGGPPGAASGSPSSQSMEAQRKKALNTPSEKSNKLDAAKNYDNSKLFLLDENANSSAILPNGMHFPSISRILSGSNGRPQMIPDVLLRSVTSAPRPNQPSFDLGNGNGPTSLSNSKNPTGGGVGGGSPFGVGKPVGGDGGAGSDHERDDRNDSDGGGAGADGASSDGDGRRHAFDEDDDDEEDDPFDDNVHSGSTSNTATSTVSSVHVLSSSSSPITQKMPNLNLKSVMVKNGSGEDTGAGGSGGAGGTYGNDRNFQGEIADISTWTIAWNIHVYLSAILYTILAVYSIFKIIFYDKLTHLFSQSYFISIHLILIIICLLRIFYLCYDAYNIHFSFNLFTSEVLLNLPLTFLTTTFAILILFLLLRSINHKTNRYSSILRPLTIMIGSGVHVGLCITLHLVESYETQQFYHKQHQLQLQNKQILMTAGRGGVGGGVGGAGHGAPPTNIQIPPRVLSLICQIIYIFICLSLGLLYLYMYRLLKRILHKSQNYIHGYNNLSYAIHITIATALLFILLAALQIYGAISISSQTKVKLSPSNALHDGSAKKTLWASHIEIDWFQWGYQFSLRFIEIVIIALLSWVTGLKTGPSKVIQREKDMEQPNASGFALFPCTSSSSQENFETDYPAVCNTNRNLHTYTMRTGKPIYDDNFALNSLNLEQNSQQDLQLGGGGPPGAVGAGMVGGVVVGGNDFQRSLETNSMRSSSHNYSNNYNGSNNDHMPEPGDDFLNDTETMPDHYENPNFELKHHNHQHHHQQQQQQQLSGSGSANQYHDIMDNCYSEPINAPQYDTKSLRGQPGHPMAQHRNYDFQNFERPNFDPTAHPQQPPHGPPGGGPLAAAAASISRGEFRASKNLKTLKSGQMQNDLGGANTMGHHHYNHHNNMVGPAGVGGGGNYGDSFDRRIGVRKSGTLNNIGAMHFNQHVGGGSGRNNNSNSSASSSASSNNRAALQQQQQQQQQQRGRGPMSGAQTLSASRSNDHHHHHHHHHPPPPPPPAGHGFAIPGSFNDRLLNGGGGAGVGGGADSLERNHPHLQQQQQLASQDNLSNNFDEGIPNGPNNAYYHSKKRSRESSSSSYTGGGPGGAVPYATNNNNNDQQTESSSSPTASLGGSIGGPIGPGSHHHPGGGGSGNGSPTTGVLPGKLAAQQDNGSMLVAEQGFVRFRALEEPALGSRTNLRADKGKLFINS